MRIEERHLFLRALGDAASANHDDCVNEILQQISEQPSLQAFVLREWELVDLAAQKKDEKLAHAQFKLATAYALAVGWNAGRKYAATTESASAKVEGTETPSLIAARQS